MKSLQHFKKRNLYVAFVAALAVTFSINTYASETTAPNPPPNLTPTATPTAQPAQR